MVAPNKIIMTPSVKYRFQIYNPIGLSKDICWIWKGPLSSNDNRAIFEHKGIEYKAARVAYMLFHNLTEFELCALHHCDNPPCVNPHHLFAGTHEDNQKDMRAKGRAVQVKGEKVGTAYLTVEIVLLIKKKLWYGQSHRAISKELDIPRPTITDISKGSTWKHVKFNGFEIINRINNHETHRIQRE